MKRLRITCYTDGSCPVNPGRAKRGQALAMLMWLVHTKHRSRSCINWPYSKTPDGRGQVFYQGKMQVVPRLVCRLVHGEPPTPKHQAAHSCENGHTGCCHPKHVRWKTQSENAMESTRRSGGSLKGAANKASKLTNAQIRCIRSSKQTQEVLAAKYGVCRNTIGNVRRNVNWRHL